MADLPCTTCRSECCGAIPVQQGELDRLVRAVAEWPDDEIERMAAQQRGSLMCPFVDTEHWRCAVHDARPTVCRLYGLTPGLECPHAPEAATQISRRDARRQLARDERKRGGVVGVLGLSIGWDEIREAVAVC